jgi:hypothetical protein
MPLSLCPTARPGRRRPSVWYCGLANAPSYATDSLTSPVGHPNTSFPGPTRHPPLNPPPPFPESPALFMPARTIRVRGIGIQHSSHLLPRPTAPPQRDGGEQQHHGMRDAAGADLRGARDRVGGVVRVGAGRGVRAPGAVARGHPGRAAPAGRAGGLRGRVLEPARPACLLPLRHGVARRAPHRAPRLRLRRHPRVRRLPRARPRLRRLPPRRLLHVAPRVRLRRPRALGQGQGLPRRLRHLQEARAPGRLHQRRPVLSVAPLPAPGIIMAHRRPTKASSLFRFVELHFPYIFLNATLVEGRG